MNIGELSPPSPRRRVLDRRTVLTEFGRGVVGIALFGGTGLWHLEQASATDDASATRWARADLGFVSAYVLARGKEAMIVDTGVKGSAPAIGKAVKTLGLSWTAVRHVVLTHAHPDHAGSIADVLKAASRAVGYVGEADAAQVRSPRSLRSVVDGDEVFGLEIVGTPGHTPGHICVLDPVGSILVAGDATGTSAGSLNGPNPQFTPNMNQARLSLEKLANKKFEIVLPGHGAPITKGGAAALAEYLARK